MKLKIKAKEFEKALSDAMLFVKENTVRPSISGVKLTTCADNKVEVMGTTLDFNYLKKVNCEVVDSGSVIFKAPLVLEYVRLIDEEELLIEGRDGVMYLGNAEFVTLVEDGFPDITPHLDEKLFAIESAKFQEIIKKVSFAAFPSMENLNINCLRIESFDGGLNFVTTDSYRLIKYHLSEKQTQNVGISLPLESSNIISKLLRGYDGGVEVFKSGNNIALSYDNTFISSRLIEVDFPDYQNIFTNVRTDKRAEVKTDDLKQSLKKSLIVAKRNLETRNGISFEVKQQVLTLISASGRAKSKENIPCICEGEALKTSLNGKYLYDFIENLEGNTIISGSSPHSMFLVESNDDKNYKYLIMPLAIRG